MSETKCLYCESDKCRCTYRVGRKGIGSTEVWVTHRSSIAHLRKAFEEMVGSRANDQPCTWKLSFTRLKSEDVAHAD